MKEGFKYHQLSNNPTFGGIPCTEIVNWLEKQREQEIKKKPIWKHWKNGIAGNGEGKQIYLIKSGDSYTLSSCLGYECDYIDLSDLDEFMLSEKQDKQKPAWSEEDEQLIDEVAVCLRKYAEKVQGGYSKLYVQSLADRIESLRPVNTCKATGWSEEDEERYLSCLKRLGTGDIRQPETINTVWLKSIKDRVQPKVELTQLDKNILEAAIAFVEQNNHFNVWCGVDKHTVLSALHSIRPQKQWKPSEEQMKQLGWVAKQNKDNMIGKELMTLYNDLKNNFYGE